MATEHSAVLLDWGGVMTSDLFGSFAAFCAEEGLDPDVLANLFRHDRDARALLIDFECGRIEEADFEPRLSTALGLTWHDGLIDRLFAARRRSTRPWSTACARCTSAACRPAWSRTPGARAATRATCWPSSSTASSSRARRASASPTRACTSSARSASASRPAECVFVDDLAFNLDPARELGMAVVHHTSAATTLAELERLVG